MEYRKKVAIILTYRNQSLIYAINNILESNGETDQWNRIKVQK